MLAQQGQQKIENIDQKVAILAENSVEIVKCVPCRNVVATHANVLIIVYSLLWFLWPWGATNANMIIKHIFTDRYNTRSIAPFSIY